MKNNLEHFDINLCNKLFDFLYPDESGMTKTEVQAELQHLNIDTRSVVSKLQMALYTSNERQKSQESLKLAGAQRISFLKRLEQIKIPGLPNLRTELQILIIQLLSGSQQAVYHRKLESAASDEDLKSLLEDILRMNELSKDENSAAKPEL